MNPIGTGIHPQRTSSGNGPNRAPLAGGKDSGSLLLDDPRVMVGAIGASAFVIQVDSGQAFSMAAFNPRYRRMIEGDDAAAGEGLDTGDRVFLTAEPFLAECRRCIETRGPVQQVEQVFLRRGPRWWQRTLIPLFDPPGQRLWILGIVLDVTDQVLARQFRQTSLTRFQDMFEETHVAMYLVDPVTLKLVDANRAALEFYGYTREEFLSRRLTDLNVASEAEIRAMIARQANVDRRCFAVRHRLANGELRDLEIHAKPVMAGGQELYFAIVTDVTERRRNEAELERAIRLADQANAAKTRFLAAASHDLRQPLQSAILFVELLAYRVRDPKQQDLVDKVQQALFSMNEMLSALLDVSRLDAGIVEAKPQDFPIQSALDRLVVEFEPLVQAAGLELRSVPCSATVRSDPQLLDRILRNLLSNALKYTERGRILLGCRRGGGTVRVQIWDTGVGFSSDQVQRIFEEYYQIGNPARDRRKGLGLGLAIVRRLADLLGHPIRVQSAAGKGSMFEVSLPVGLVPCRPARRSRSREHGKGSGVVAVIDDDMLLLGGLRLFLEEFGYDVVAGIGAGEVIAALQQRGLAPDMVLADYRLADGETGSDAVRRLRAAFGKAVPGILLTGDTSPDRLREAKDSGLTLLHKPVKPKLLAKQINRLLQHQAGKSRQG